MTGSGSPSAQALSGVCVVELGSSVAAAFATRLMGDLGAEVIKVEHPEGGDPIRSWAPLIPPGRAGAGESLLFRYLNGGKKSVGLDVTAVETTGALKSLLHRADIVVDASPSGVLDELGLGYDSLRASNPRLVLTSVSAFGRGAGDVGEGVTDLILYATSGLMSISGTQYPFHPLKHGLRQGLYAGGLNAAYATLAAHFRSLRLGLGEHVDLSVRECLTTEMVAPLSQYVFSGVVAGRHPPAQDPMRGDPVRVGPGYVALQSPRAVPMERIAEFLELPELAEPRYATKSLRVTHAEHLRAIVEARLKDEDPRAFFDRASKFGMVVGLVQDAADLLSCPQLEHRGFFHTVRVSGDGEPSEWTMPGRLNLLSATPSKPGGTAPLLGEHTEEVLAAAVPLRDDATAPEPPASLPFVGLRVVDLSAVVAGPLIGAVMADLGADVIKVEGPSRIDTLRMPAGPMLDRDPGSDPWNRGPEFNTLNRGKRSLSLDLKSAEGRAVLLDLLGQADVAITNFRPHVLPSWGISPETIESINPRLIVVSNTGFGASGPWRDFAAQGTSLEGTMGIASFTGYTGGRPSKAGQSYPDFIASWAALTSIFAALIWRESSGRGQWIDQSMYEVGAALLPEALLHQQVTGIELERNGAADLDCWVSGVFESAEPDRWVAVTLPSVEDFRRAGRHISALAGADVQSVLDRDVAESALGEWVGGQSREAAVSTLRDAGVLTGAVLNVVDLLSDPTMEARGFFQDVDLGSGRGVRPLIGLPFRFLGGGPGPAVRAAAPHFGADNQTVLRGILGLDESRIAALYAEGTVTDAPVGLKTLEPVDYVALAEHGSYSALHDDYLDRLARRVGRSEDPHLPAQAPVATVHSDHNL